MKAGCARSNSMSMPFVVAGVGPEDGVGATNGVVNVTATETVWLPAAPCAPWIWIRPAGMTSGVVAMLAASGKPVSGSLATVNDTSPGLALIVSTAPVYVVPGVS